MKLVKQAKLSFREGKSDKVYEVDLCEVGPGQCVVNFRYGRRGTPLRDGSKTVVAVAAAEAERIFDKLVTSKLEKGYEHDTGGSSAATSRPSSVRPAVPPTTLATPTLSTTNETNIATSIERSPLELSVLKRLRERNASSSKWNLYRAVWRAGELGLRGAERDLLELLKTTETSRNDDNQIGIHRYTICWALSRCGGAQTIPALERIYNHSQEKENIRRIAGEGLRHLYSTDDKCRFIDAVIDGLPADLARLARSGPSHEYAAALHVHLRSTKKDTHSLLYRSYLIDNAHVRPALLSILRVISLGIDDFRQVRALFKAAELRRDGEVFGVLAHRFERVRPSYHRRWRRINKDKPFQEHTRSYLRRRVWRTLRRLAADKSPDFVSMAVGVLLPFTDADAHPVRSRHVSRWRRSSYSVRWDRFAPYWAFNHLLYGKSPRYEPDRRGRAWRCRADYTPDKPAPAIREESFPDLWEQTPAGLLHLLDESRCRPVHEFAVKALRACAAFLAELDTSVAIMLLGAPYDVTVELGADLALALYDADDPDTLLLVAMADCVLDIAREQARLWIRDQAARFVDDDSLMAALCTSPLDDTRAFAAELLAAHASAMSQDAARRLVVRVIAILHGLGATLDVHDDAAMTAVGARIRGAGDVLLAALAAHLHTIGLEVIRDLLAHPHPEAHALAGRILIGHRDLSDRVPDSVLFAMLESADETVRNLGAQLLAKLTPAALAERRELVIELCLSKHAALREGIRPAIARLASADAALARALVDAFVQALMHKAADGVHSHLLSLLRDELRPHLGHLGKDTVWTLLGHRHPHAQELGGVLLGLLVDPEALTIAEIIKLTSHEILAVRQGAWSLCEQAATLERMRKAMPSAIRLLDAKWDDSRQWAFGYFRERFTKDDFTPAVLVAICDSIRSEVQQFGREMITRYFRDEDGQEYLLKLSEHPSDGLQRFATNYLERYAAGDPARIRELEPYFVTVLSRVNRGAVAKRRCIAFLEQQALGHRDIAAVVAEIFTRQSATIAIGDREAMIRAMVHIRRAYPDIALPIAIQPVEVRHGV